MLGSFDCKKAQYENIGPFYFAAVYTETFTR